jgi:hypothetical protein
LQINAVWNDSSDSIEKYHKSMQHENNIHFFPESKAKTVEMEFRGTIDHPESFKQLHHETNEELVQRVS